MMTAREKLDEARFFLQQLDTSRSGSIEFMYYLSAFLGACRSVPDHLLYEYGQKFLGISHDDFLDQQYFGLLAKSLNHARAQDFIKWWRSETERLGREEPGSVLVTKRNVVIHRGRPAFTFSLTLVQPMYVGTYVSPLSSSGSFVTSSAPPVTSPPPTTPDVTNEAYFSDYMRESIRSLCKRFLQEGKH